MSDTPPTNFINQLIEVIKRQISNEEFGVSELAREVNMSRSNLLRKVKKLTNASVSQFIREVRLREAMEILQHSDDTVSEIAFKVGFNSTSYFIKCFHDYYGYTPGEVEKLSASLSSAEPHYPHQLVAVVFTDIQGYTAIMQENEKRALAFIQKHREIFHRLTKKYKGRIIQYYGDGTLSIFHSVIDAVNCSIEMQRDFQAEPMIPVRIGIHSGDVIFNKNGIVGDGVNIASRIESLGIAGAILISEKVYDEVKNQPDIHTKSMGIHKLKNVVKPIEVYAVSNPGIKIPPSITSNSQKESKVEIHQSLSTFIKRWKWIGLLLLGVSLLYLMGGNYFEKISNINPDKTGYQKLHEKSIAVLPFINDSNDTSNLYIINGLMEAVLNNLQHIDELKVVSRTSVEKFRKSAKLIPEIARELNVKYIVEGSGQKLGNQILLNIQLINGQEDNHIWSGQYNKKLEDIFDLQLQVAEDIANGIAVAISPETREIISQTPTENLAAYDDYLKAREYMQLHSRNGLLKALPFFRKAIQKDNDFALAYAEMAICYYYLDALLADKIYEDSLNYYANLALLYDDRLPQSMLANGLNHLNKRDYKLAENYLVKAHKVHPSSAPILNILADFYTNYVPNTEKYLEYALQGMQLNIGTLDSINASFSMLHIANAFVQTGFIKKSKHYIDKSMEMYPQNLFAEYLSAYIDFAENKNLRKTRKLLEATLMKDTSRVDVMQEVAKICYYLRNYKDAARYYTKYLNNIETNNLAIYPGEDIKMAKVFREVGSLEKSQQLLEKFGRYATYDQSIYKEMSLAVFHAEKGQNEQAIVHLQKFARQDNFTLWTVLFLPIDPLIDNITDDPRVIQSIAVIKSKFEKKHKNLEKQLEEKGLL